MKKYEEAIKQAEQAGRVGETAEALKYYQKAIELEPGCVDAYYSIALLYHQQGQLDQAIENFEKAAELDVSDASVFNNLGALYYSKEALKEAESSFKKAIAIEPDYPEALYGLGNVYLKQERIYDAIVAFQRYSEFESSSETAKAKIEECYEKRNLESVKQNYKKILIVMYGDIGSMVMLTPALRALKEFLPEADITVLGNKLSVDTIEGLGVEVLTEPEEDASYDIGFFAVCSADCESVLGQKLRQQCGGKLFKGQMNNPNLSEFEYHMQIPRFMGYTGPTPEPYCAVKEDNSLYSQPVARFLRLIFEPKKVLVIGNSPDTKWLEASFPYISQTEFNTSLSFRDDSFDLVICLGDLEDFTAVEELQRISSRYIITRASSPVTVQIKNQSDLSDGYLPLLRRNDVEVIGMRALNKFLPFLIYEKVWCPICGNPMEDPIVRDMLYCGKCGLFRKRFVLPAGALKARLKNVVIGSLTRKDGAKRRLQEAEEQIEWIESYISIKGRLLDVGASGGFIMKVARDKGWATDGNEISIKSIEWAKQNFGLNLRYGLLEELNLPEKSYDLVVLWHTLEHVIDIRETLEEIRNILKDGGYVVIAVPIKESPSELERAYEDMHNYEFTVKALSTLLCQMDFEEIARREEVPTGVKEIHTVYKLRNA